VSGLTDRDDGDDMCVCVVLYCGGVVVRGR
jgi:hypothetical protein